MLERRVISTDGAPGAIGPYSQGVLVGGVLYVSGQLGIDPGTGKMVEGGVVEQTKRAFENVRAILGEAGMDFCNIVQVQVFLADIGDFGAVNEVYASYFDGDYPARAAFEVGNLPAGGLVEILVTATE